MSRADRSVASRFGQNLAYARRRSGLSQEEVAIRAELHRTEIGMLERGVRLPRVDTMLKLAGALEEDPGELLDGLDWSPAIPTQGRFQVESGADREAS